MLHRTAHPARWLTVFVLFAGSPASSLAQPAPPTKAEINASQTESVRVLVVKPGDTLTHLLAGAGVEAEDAKPVISALAPIFPPRRLQPGHEVTVRQDPSRDDALLALILEPQPGRTVTVTRSATGWQATEEEAARHRHLVLARGEVTGTMFQDFQQAGVPPAMGLGLIRMLTHSVDFQRELQPGDRFAVLFERFRDAEGGLLRDGEVLHAEFQLSNRHLSIWRQQTANGPEWFDENGRSLRRNFLRTPLDGARVTSGFGQRRHPVLGFTRMHQGIDFAAPTGTPVLAAADGVVARANFAGGYGRIIVLQHPNGIETRYAHLSGFARGLRQGDQVSQGQVIGRVGSSGMATGPHLHYEIAEAGRLVDPAIARPAATIQLAGAELKAFQQERLAILSQVAHLEPKQEVAWAE